MKLCLKILAIAAIAASTYSLTGCSAPPSFSYKNVSIAITSYCTDCASGALQTTYNPAFPQPPAAGSVILMPNAGQGGTSTFVATVTNAPQTNVTWTLYPTPNLNSINNLPSGTSIPIGESGDSAGTIHVASGNTVYYSVPAPPVYSGAALQQAQAMGIPQGDVLLVASVPDDPANPASVATANQLVQIYGGASAQGPPSTYLTPNSPTSPAGLTNPVVTVPTNTTFAFYGGTIGSAPCLPPAGQSLCTSGSPAYTTDNTSIWEVGPAPYSLGTAIPGGNSTYGTIDANGVYTAPAVIPTTTNSGTKTSGEVVVVVVSHAVNSVATYAYVGID